MSNETKMHRPSADQAPTRYTACEVCWTQSWEPIEDEAECALNHPHGDDSHVRCLCCWQHHQVEIAVEALKSLAGKAFWAISVQAFAKRTLDRIAGSRLAAKGESR